MKSTSLWSSVGSRISVSMHVCETHTHTTHLHRLTHIQHTCMDSQTYNTPAWTRLFWAGSTHACANSLCGACVCQCTCMWKQFRWCIHVYVQDFIYYRIFFWRLGGGKDIRLWANHIPSDLGVYAPTEHPKIYIVWCCCGGCLGPTRLVAELTGFVNVLLSLHVLL